MMIMMMAFEDHYEESVRVLISSLFMQIRDDYDDVEND